MRDYVQGETHLMRFYEGEFQDPGAYREKAQEVDRRFHRDARERVASLVRASSDAARAGLDRFLEEGGYLVTTGQQPGLFSGPLFSLYKALTAVKLAQALAPVLERPVLPLFWIASEDHDWEEVDHTYLLDQGNDLRTFRVPPQGRGPARPLHRIPVTEGLQDVVVEFLQTLPDNDFKDTYVTLIREGYSRGSTLPHGFQTVLEGLLSDLPMLFVDAANPALKEASQGVLFKELEAAEEHESLLHRVASHLEMDGYPVQVPILPGGVNLFMEGPSGRDRLYRTDSGFRLNHADVPVSMEEIRDQVGADPGVLSPNVLLRPVVESALFPTLRYVAGPGELAYYAHL
mgnify:FL=1